MNQSEQTSYLWNNEEIATRLDRVAELLEAQDANPYRVRAYRMGAETARGLQQPVREILEKAGVEGLRELPAIGASLARSIKQLVDTGQINLLEQLRSETSAARVLGTVPGIGPKLAERIHAQLGIETLTDLQNAVYDGRLKHVPGFGPNRLRGVRESLAGRFRRRERTPERIHRQPLPDQPAVSELLEVDREYRQKAKQLPRIAPRRFNPTGEAWLPVLQTERATVHYTALFSNTARAHDLGALYDWVVIYRDDSDGGGQWTVVTAHYGALRGRRIVRGREAECTAYYERQPA